LVARKVPIHRPFRADGGDELACDEIGRLAQVGPPLMPQPSDFPSACIAMAAGLGLIALFLGLRQWYELRAREEDLPQADRDHLAHQDLRRGLGVGVLVAIAILMLVGSRTMPRIGDKMNLLFVILWTVVLALLVVMLALAFLDWRATRIYARRARMHLVRESLAAIRKQARDAARSRQDQKDSNGLDAK
jgi:hypothetical protein